MIKIIVIDDSPFMRRELCRILESDPKIKVIGTGRDGYDAIEKTKTLKPDVVVLDLEMPRMDGMTAIKEIMDKTPSPCVIISAFTQDSAPETIEALRIGAVDCIAKPSGTISLDISEQAQIIIQKIKLAATAKLTRSRIKRSFIKKTPTRKKERPFFKSSRDSITKTNIVVIGVSTGGPRTLPDIISELPADLNACVIIAQHMPPKFTKVFANRLDNEANMLVKEANKSDKIEHGIVYICPGQFHLTFPKANTRSIILSTSPEKTLYRPSADILFESAANKFGNRTIGVLLTGMGNDGTKGLQKIKDAGGISIAENQSTCIIYGMPKCAIEQGVVDHILPSYKIAQKIISLTKRIF